MPHPQEHFTPAERERLRPYFTDLDGPVFGARQPAGDDEGRAVRALLALPGHAAAPVPGRVRRLAAGAAGAAAHGDEGARSARAVRDGVRRLRGRLGGPARRRAHRLRVGLERAHEGPPAPAARRLPGAVDALHPPTTAPMPGGGYRYLRDRTLGPEYAAAMDFAVRHLRAAAAARAGLGRTRRSRTTPASRPTARERAIQAKALDLLRGLLPAASLSHMGIFATGQTYEQLILHLLAHPLPEARACGARMLDGAQGRDAELRRPRRARRTAATCGCDYLSDRREAEQRWARAAGAGPRRRAPSSGPSVRLLHVDGDEDRLLAALLFEAAGRAGGAHAGRGRGARRGASARGCWPTSWASASTAATAPAAASRPCATASRSCPTTARSATFSATGCSPSSGSR